MKKVGSLIVALLIGVLGLFLSACTTDYSKLQLTAVYEKNEEGSLELNLNESVNITFKVENMIKGFNASLSLSSTSNKVSTKILSYDEKTGESQVEITAISFGDCVLRATTMEAGKYVDVNIKVNLAIEDFALKDEVKLFAVKGENNPKPLILDNSYFTFTPFETTQKTIVWYDNEGNEIQEINPNDEKYKNENKAIVKAKSLYLDKEIEVEIELIDEIKVNNVYKLIEDNTTFVQGPSILFDNQGNYINQDKNVIIYLVGNKILYARDNIRIEIDKINPLLKNKNLYKSDNLVMATTFDTTTQQQEGTSTFFDISLQALQEGVVDINIQFYYEGYSGYEVEVVLHVEVVNAPETFLINDKQQNLLQTQELFDNANSTIFSSLLLSTAPSTAIFDKVVMEFSTDFEKYVKLTCGGLEISKANENAVLTNLALPIIAKGIKASAEQEVYLTFKLYWGESIGIEGEEPLEYTVKFVVNTGASSLNIDEKYVQGIYLDINQGQQIFSGLYVNEVDAWTENLTIYNMSTDNVVKIEEHTLTEDTRAEGKTVSLKLTPIKTGTAKYSIYLQNGVYRDLYVTVINQPESMSVDVEKINGDIKNKTYDEKNDLTDFTLQLTKDKENNYFADINYYIVLNGTKTTISDLYEINIDQALVSSDIKWDEQTQNIHITNNFNGELISWYIRVKKVEDFALVSSEDDPDFMGIINMTSFIPVESVKFVDSEQNVVKDIFLYSQRDLGYIYENESKQIAKLMFNPEELDLANLEITWSASIDNTYSKNTGIMTITEYGTYDTVSGLFTLDVSAMRPQNFSIIANISYFGQILTAQFNIHPQDYIPVTSVKLSNYVDEIYLSPTNEFVDIYPYVLPTDAIHKQLLYRFEPDAGCSAAIVSLQVINDKNGNVIGVRVIYGDNGKGTGNLVIIPQSSIESLTDIPSSALKIPVRVPDGSYTNPYKITTAEEFLTINQTGLDKHYIIENIIDLTNYQVSLGEFTGTINGLGKGKIIGLNINDASNQNIGLFEKISTKTTFEDFDKDINGNYHSGEISNLIIEGKINLTVNKSANISVVCGTLENNAKLTNVSVVLQNSQIQVETTDIVNIGILAGYNNGEISSITGQYNYLSKSYKYTNHTLVDMENGTLTILYNCDENSASEFSSIGGVVGFNNGTIQKVTNSNQKLIGKSNYVAITNILLKRNSTAPNSTFVVGGLVGKNQKSILSDGVDTTNYSDYLKILGKITIEAQDNNIVGGILGINSGAMSTLTNAVTRLKLISISDGNSGAFVGGIYGSNNGGNVSNCVIQALEDGKSMGLDLTQIYSKTFGLTTSTIDNNKISIFGKQGGENLIAQTYIERTLIDNKDTKATITNYYGDIFIGNINSVYYQAQFDKTTASVSATVSKNAMVTDDENDAKLSYLYFYQSKDIAEQNLLSIYNSPQLPYDVVGEISIISYNTDIINIANDGTLNLLKTGHCRLRLQSNLNATKYQDVYVLVVGAFDDYVLTLDSIINQQDIIGYGGMISILSGKSQSLGVQWIKQNIIVGAGYEVEMLAGDQSILTDINVPENVCFEFEKIGNIYVLKSLKNAGSQDFDLRLYLSYTLNGKLYTSENLKNENENEYSLVFTAQNKQGATDVKLNKENISVEPADSFDIQLEVDTDSFVENIIIEKTKLSNGIFENSQFVKVIETKRTIKISVSSLCEKLGLSGIQQFTLNYADEKEVNIWVDFDNKKLSLSNDNFTNEIEIVLEVSDSYNFSIEGHSNINYVFNLSNIIIYYNISFDIENIDLYDIYSGTYYITFMANSTKVSKAIEIDVLPQEINKILFESYEGATENDINGGKQQSIYLNPGSPNHFKINIVPVVSQYDYIDIVSDSNKFLLTLIDEKGQTVSGAQTITNGLRINRELVNNGQFFVRYLIGTNDVENEDVYNFDVTAYYDNDAIYNTSKQIIIKFAKDVTMQILNAQKYDNTYYLARGMNYDYEIDMYGYNLDEIIIQTDKPDFVSVDKINNKIKVTTGSLIYNDSTAGAPVTLTVFGQKQVDDEIVTSVPDIIKIVITEYLINDKPNTTIIKQGENGIVSVAMGDYYIFDTQLINNINSEINYNISGISATAQKFTDEVTTKSVWQYQIGQPDGSDGYIFNDQAWTDINSDINSVDTDGNFVITLIGDKIKFNPLRVHSQDNPVYKFRLMYGFDYLGGEAKFKHYNNNELKAYGSVIDEFVFNVYQVSAIDAPTPVSTYTEFLNMQDGAYYILLNDITLPSDYVPFNKNIAGLDGNGKNIILSSNFSTETLNNFGVFEKIYQNSLIRNLNIKISNSLRWTFTNLQNINVGLLAGENNGVITNCNVVTTNENSVRFVFNGTSSSNAYVGGLVGVNNGYITNSKVDINLNTSANIGGLVCTNNGKIASSVVYNSLIINTTNEQSAKTAGFVCYNEGDQENTGIILTSYVSGVHTGTLNLPIYANDSSKQIRSSSEVGGFVYSNKGKITDCYSDIPIISSSKTAGFVFVNGGEVSNSFSTSMLKSLSQESYGFVADNVEGGLNYCSYLSEPDMINYSINISNNSISGLSVYNIAQYSKPESFSTFAFGETSDITKGIWFYPKNTELSMFNFQSKTFIKNRPELISANIIAESVKELNIQGTVTDKDTGEVIYAYNNVGQQQGSVLNPYIIIDALTFEQYILNTNTNSINTKYYRLVKDIDYDNEYVNSNIYKTIFCGDFEGNGMLIENYTIDTSESLASAGLFCKIGNGNALQGCIKNLTVKPKFINLPNSMCVGALAGTLDGGCLFNVEVKGTQNNTTMVVLGKNLVGGVVGRAINNFKLVDCSSSISANSTFRSATVLGEESNGIDNISSYYLTKDHTINTMTKTSYAGSIAGVLAGTGYVSRVSVSGNVASIGEFAGLLFGGIGNGVSVTQIKQNVVQGQFVQAAVYGGILAGECYGYVSDIEITSAIEISNLYKTVPFVAKAVGGVVGLLGDTQNIPDSAREGVMSSYGLQNVKVSAYLTTQKISTIGGIVGEMIGGRLLKCGYIGNVSGYENVGGLVGQINSIPSAKIKQNNKQLNLNGMLVEQFVDTGYEPITSSAIDQCFVKDGEISVTNDNIGIARIGGLVGDISLYGYGENDKNIFAVSNSYNQNNIKVNSTIYGQRFDIYAGGLVGSIRKSLYNNSLSQDILIKFEYVYSDSNIELNLRDLKQNVAVEDLVDMYNIYYSDLIAHNEHSTWFKMIITNDGTDKIYSSTVSYQGKQTQYTESSNDCHSLILKYYDKGALVTYNEQSLNLIKYNDCFKNIVYYDEGFNQFKDGKDVENLKYSLEDCYSLFANRYDVWRATIRNQLLLAWE